MARKKAIDLEAYSMLDQYCIGLNEYLCQTFNALTRMQSLLEICRFLLKRFALILSLLSETK